MTSEIQNILLLGADLGVDLGADLGVALAAFFFAGVFLAGVFFAAATGFPADFLLAAGFFALTSKS